MSSLEFKMKKKADKTRHYHFDEIKKQWFNEWKI